MIDQIMRYLTSRQVPFRVLSYPMPEAAPEVAPHHARFGQLVDTHIVLADGRPALAVVPAGMPLDVLALGQELGTVVIEGSAEDLPAPFAGMRFVPPLGGMLGVPLIVEARIPGGTLVFRAFGDDHSESFVEVIFDDLARIERPRPATFVIAGALPPSSGRHGPQVFVGVGEAPAKPARARAPKHKAAAGRRRSAQHKAAAERR
jgi:hypothetical protein